MMYERLLASGRSVPAVTEDVDLVRVVVRRRIVHPGVIRLLTEADQRHDLTQRERIALGHPRSVRRAVGGGTLSRARSSR